MQLQPITLCILHRGLSLVQVLGHTVQLYYRLDLQQAFFQQNSVAGRIVEHSRSHNWISHSLVCFQLVTNPLCHRTVYYVELS
jgi:hypothetical protein